MSGYRPGYSEAHSPTYNAGVEDAIRDAFLVGSCPPLPPYGPLQEGAMYMRGYNSVPLIYHYCDKSCSRLAPVASGLRTSNTAPNAPSTGATAATR